MTIEIETRLFGIPMKRTPLEEDARVKPEDLVMRHLHRVGAPAHRPSGEKQVYSADEINRANFKLRGKYPGISKKIVWKQ